MADFPASVDRKLIDTKHPDYDQNFRVWFNTAVMYEGGQLIKQHANEFVLQRPKEDPGVYAHRLELFAYENNIGTGFGWYQAEMFNADPKIDIRLKGADGNPDTKTPLPATFDAFYNQRFLKNCDRRGKTFLDFAKELYKQALLFRKCYVLVDRQPVDVPLTLEQKRQNSAYDEYLNVYSPIDVINWDCDDNGELNWVIIYQCSRSQTLLAKAQKVERWYIYNREQYAIYESRTEDGDVSTNQTDKEQPIQLVRTGEHAMSAQNKVPLIQVEFPEGWWLGNRAYLTAMEHIDTSNVLRWSLRMAGLAVPVIFTDDDISSIAHSEYMFLKFSSDSKYEWSEPEGRSWEHLANRLNTLKEEIWRSMYLVAQARSTSATASAQSGVSKQQDMQPSHDVLGGMGGVLRSALQLVLEMVMKARGEDDKLVPDIRGFEFEDELTAAELDVIESVQTLGVPSRTFEKEVDKQTARLVLKGANPDTLQTVFEEIDAAPTRAEADQQQQEQQLQMRVKTMQAGVTAATKDPVKAAESN